MRFSYFITLTVLPLALAAPINNSVGRDLKGVLGNISSSASKLINANATGIAGAVKQAITNPALTSARAEVVKGLGDTGGALSKVSKQASATGNSGVQTLVTQAQSGLASAQGGVTRIGESIVTGTTPSKNDQKIVAQGINSTEIAIKGMNAAITTPDQTLSKNIADAVTSVNSLKNGAEGVLAASNLTLADLGLSGNFAK